MTLIKSISGIRGTIGQANNGKNLTPLDVVHFTSAYCTWLLNQNVPKKIVLGRDARISGEMVSGLVANTIIAMGIDVVDLGLSTTPTVEMAVVWENAGGGIILTASHNPKQWNALKLLNHNGEFIGHEDAEEVLNLAEKGEYKYAEVDDLGSYSKNDTYLKRHIDEIVNHKYVDAEAIRKAGFTILVDGINSSGAVAIPPLLEALGVNSIVTINEEPNGEFAHNPEPIPQHLSSVCSDVKRQKAHLGIVVDPDVDRLCFINEDGSLFGEEFTLVAIADYVLSQAGGGNTVSNLSSTIALQQITQKYGGEYSASAVGEVNVVNKMKETDAIIGGEGNGGIIYPDFHYGRDALVGIGLFLTHLAKSGQSASQLRNSYPRLHIVKNKIQLDDGMDVDAIISKLAEKYESMEQNHEDGLKIFFEGGNDWVHMRKSNTEPIIRIYTESDTQTMANNIAEKIKKDVGEILSN